MAAGRVLKHSSELLPSDSLRSTSALNYVKFTRQGNSRLYAIQASPCLIIAALLATIDIAESSLAASHTAHLNMS